MKKAGRPPKSASGNKPWEAGFFVQCLREALEIVRNKIEMRDDLEPILVADAKGLAALMLGILLQDYCDPDNPAPYLRMIADEWEGKLMHSPKDENIWKAFLLAERNTFPEWRKQYEKLLGRRLDNDKDKGELSSLRRSIGHIIGSRLYAEPRNRNGSKNVSDTPRRSRRRSARRAGKKRGRASHRRSR